jgi:hypothetical protein
LYGEIGSCTDIRHLWQHQHNSAAMSSLQTLSEQHYRMGGDFLCYSYFREARGKLRVQFLGNVAGSLSDIINEMFDAEPRQLRRCGD